MGRGAMGLWSDRPRACALASSRCARARAMRFDKDDNLADLAAPSPQTKSVLSVDVLRPKCLARPLLDLGAGFYASTRDWGRLMKKWMAVAPVGVLVFLALGAHGWSQSQPLSFGVIIWRSPTLTAQFWNPILRHVSSAAVL